MFSRNAEGECHTWIPNTAEKMEFQDAPYLVDPTNFDIALELDNLFRDKPFLLGYYGGDDKDCDADVALHTYPTYAGHYGDEGFGIWDERIVFC